MTTKYLSLDLWETNSSIVTVMQGEDNARAIEITVTDKGNTYNLTNSSVLFYMTKPDGTVVYNNATVTDAENGVVEVAITDTMSQAYGLATNCELHIITAQASELKVTGLNIYIKKSMDESEITSSDEFLALNQALARCTQIVYTQQTPSTVWIYQHNLDKFPKVTVTDSNDNVILADVKYADSDTVAVYVNPACTGKIVIN